MTLFIYCFFIFSPASEYLSTSLRRTLQGSVRLSANPKVQGSALNLEAQR